jgi:hypothetical protein
MWKQLHFVTVMLDPAIPHEVKQFRTFASEKETISSEISIPCTIPDYFRLEASGTENLADKKGGDRNGISATTSDAEN